MRCSANGASLRHKVTFSPVNGSAARNLHLISQLTLTASPRRGSQGWNRTARLAEQTGFCPEYRNFFRCAQHLCRCRHRSHPFPGGVSGGGAALSPGFQLNLCSLPKHGAHSAAQSPECAFLAKPFFAQAKNGVNLRRRSHKISVTKAKTA